MFYIRDYTTVASPGRLPAYRRRNLRTQSPCVIKLPALRRGGRALLPLKRPHPVVVFTVSLILDSVPFSRARSLAFRTLRAEASPPFPPRVRFAFSRRECTLQRCRASLRGNKGCARGDACTPCRSRPNNLVARPEKLSARECRILIK